MDANELPNLIEKLPAFAREKLAEGPMLPREQWHDCRVCDALEDVDCEAAVLLIDYHDFCGTIGVGPQVYARCVEIYRAAGWEGEYDARDLHGFEGDDS